MFALLAASDSPPAAAIVGAVAGVLALLWNVFNYLWARRPQVRVAQRLLLDSDPDADTYGVEITIVNVGHTVESVMEIGLCRAPSRVQRVLMGWSPRRGRFLQPASTEHFARGRVDEGVSALRAISNGVARMARSEMTRFVGFYDPSPGAVRSPAWALPPGAIAQVDQSFLGGEREQLPGDPDATTAASVVSGVLTPYARLARGTVRFGRPIQVDAKRVRALRERIYADHE